LLFVVPFYFAARWSIALGKARQDARYGVGLFAITAIVLATICFSAFSEYNELAAQKLWTAATFALAMGLFWSIPVMLLCWFAHWLLWPKGQT
jgi:hypothetical protein